MPRKVRAVGQHANGIIQDMKAIGCFFNDHGISAGVRDHPVQGRHRPGDGVGHARDPDRAQQGGGLVQGGAEPQEKPGNFGGCDGKPGVRAVVRFVGVVIRVPWKIEGCRGESSFVDAVGKEHGGEILPDAHIAVTVADLVGPKEVSPLKSFGHNVQFRV